MNSINASFFDKIIDRNGTKSIKWDMYAPDILPMWVADMDLPSPPEVTQALCERAAHPVYGYTEIDPSYHTQPMLDWWQNRHQLTLTAEQICYLPGVVSGLYLAVRAFTQPGDGVVVQTPVYGPFYHVIEHCDRKLIANPLLHDASGWHMDFDNLERCFEQGAKALILCSPHNPIGRVWTQEELSTLLALCKAYDVLILSDEIHADFIYPGYRHTPMLSLPDAPARTLAFVAPSKTFNIAGLQLSAAFVPDDALRERFAKEMQMSGTSAGNLFALTAVRAAYAYGAPWLEALVRYFDESRHYIAQFLATELPRIGFTQVEGTFLTLLDFSAYGLEVDALRARLEVPNGLALSPGTSFRVTQAMRLNFGCSHATLEEGLNRLKTCMG